MEKRSAESKQKKKQYNVEYVKANYKRVPLNLSIEKYEEIKAASSASGESINGYIKKAIDDRLNTGN